MINKFYASFKKQNQRSRLFGVGRYNVAYFAALLRKKSKQPLVLFARDHLHMERIASEINFFNPSEKVLKFPSWDVQPYDRISAGGQLQAQRLEVLSSIKQGFSGVLLTTVNAVSIKIPPLSDLPDSLTLYSGQVVDRSQVVALLERCGYLRVGTVMEPGEYTLRGSLLDIFIATEEDPVRFDFFDDEIETIKFFDPVTQRTTEVCKEITVKSVSEILLDEDKIATFRKGYRELFPHGHKDRLYEDITNGLKSDLSEHYLPLFFKQPLTSLFDILPEETFFVSESLADEAFAARWKEIKGAYKTRKEFEIEDIKDQVEDIYRPLSPESLYMSEKCWQEMRQHKSWLQLEDFDDGAADLLQVNMPSVSFGTHEKHQTSNLLDQTVVQIKNAVKTGAKIYLTAFTPSSLSRMEKTLHDHGLENVQHVKTWQKAQKAEVPTLGVSVLSWGFYDHENGTLVVTEQDLFGEKNNRPLRKRKKSNADVLTHFSELEIGNFVVHTEHGIGRFEGLVTLTVGDARQDFLHIVYDSDDKLYVPAVSLDVLSKYAGEGVRLDRLGGAAWQARKAKVKKNLLEMAGELVNIAANRKIRKGHRYSQPDGLYDEFCAEFPYIPTVEQLKAVEDIEGDMYGSGAMDRLVVGDVGFGKTEVALRAAFIAAADGKQVAVIVPTTLLARQHHDVFATRFKNFPFKVAVLSRLVTGKEKATTLEGLKKGAVDIVIGTHALLSNSLEIHNLGLVIVDEEQRFGVAHKEKLKALKNNVDVLTLTATPIPRTLQMSLSGMRSLSLITTPPVDRLAIRTYVMKYDRKVMREAILREIFRNGQIFVVTPRVDGLQKLADSIAHLVPEAKVRIAHGQMPKEALDRTMTDFYDGKFNVLVATTIIESGIDVPRANTMIIHRADRFGLAQLYQLRGRVGRSKVRAYSYMLLPEGTITDDAVKRLRVLQRLEGIGAGFQLASYDMDIRGAGNILGTEQSGHIKEVGFELYNQMLQEAIQEIKAAKEGNTEVVTESFVPTLNLGLSFLIPEDYVEDMTTRMSLYRRLSSLGDEAELQDFQDEMLDRFGNLPAEVIALMDVVRIKNRCKELNIEKIDVGPKGTVISFYENTFAKPQQLLGYIMEHKGLVTIKQDQRIVFHKSLPDGLARLRTVHHLLQTLEEL